MKNTPLFERDMTPQCAELRYDDPCVKAVVGESKIASRQSPSEVTRYT